MRAPILGDPLGLRLPAFHAIDNKRPAGGLAGRSADAIWSGNPNEQLVAQVADLAPSIALEVGAGEGADVPWCAVVPADVPATQHNVGSHPVRV
jgi:hypothetical protein